MRAKSKKNRGFTLVELVLAIAITAIIIYVGSQFVQVGLREFRVVSKEYAVQHGVRAAVTNISNVVKESTAIFAVGENKFDPKDVKNSMKPEWSYIALIEEPLLDESGNPVKDKTGQPVMTSKLINFVWVPENKDGSKGFHKAMDITPGQWRIKDAENNRVSYEIGFYRDEKNKPMLPKDVDDLMERDKIVKVYVKGTVDGDTSFDLNNEVLARNANQIVDSRPKLHRDYPITALAYRTQPLGELAADAAVVFVVDISGSMERNLAGGVEKDVDKQRAAIMKKNAKKFVDELEKSGRIDLYFVPFATHLYGRISTTKESVDIDWQYMSYQKMLDKPEIIPPDKVNGTHTENAMEIYKYIKELYQGRAWTDPTSQKNVEEIMKKLDAAASHDLMQRDAHHSETRTKLELIRDIYLYSIRFLQQPYELEEGKGQTSLAHQYIDKMLSPVKNGGTNMGAAVREGYKILEKSNKKLKYLVLLSDGGPEHFDYQKDVYKYDIYIAKNLAEEPKKPDLMKDGDTIPTVPTEEELKKKKEDWHRKYSYIKDETKTTDEDRLVPMHGKGDYDKGYELDGRDMLRGGYKDDPDIYKLALLPNPGKGAYNDRRFVQLSKDKLDEVVKGAMKTPPEIPSYKLYRKVNWETLPNGDVRPTYPKRPDPTSAGEFLNVDLVKRRMSGRWRGKHYLEVVMSKYYGMNVKRGGDYFIKRTFLIGFASDPPDPKKENFKKNMEIEIKRFSEAGGGTEITEYKDASSDVSLENVFKTMSSTIQEDMWYFVGP